MDLLTFIAILILGSAIAYNLKKGFNEVVSGLESIDERLRKIEEKTESN